MLLGEYEHTIDEKNRLTLPAKFRQAFAEGVVITRGMDGCLFAYPRSDWERLVESRLGELDPFSREGRVMERFFFSGAAEVEVDRQGRIMVPATLARGVSLGREVVVAGVRDRLEIWDRTAWRTHLTEVEGSAEHVAESLAKRD
jgi:MraZ protein